MIEIAAWRLRCNNCNVAYAPELHTEQEAQEVHQLTDGLCEDCETSHSAARPIATAEGIAR